jgi:hypothetical protein
VIGSERYPAEAGRYHLYIMAGCPWAHRTRLVRTVKGLETIVSLSKVAMTEPTQTGWMFDDEHPDPIAGRRFLHEVYAAGAPGYTGRVTVPLHRPWDGTDVRAYRSPSWETGVVSRTYGGRAVPRTVVGQPVLCRILAAADRPLRSRRLERGGTEHRPLCAREGASRPRTISGGWCSCAATPGARSEAIPQRKRDESPRIARAGTLALDVAAKRRAKLVHKDIVLAASAST